MTEQVHGKREKLVLGAVILGGIAALVLGVAYLGESIAAPLKLTPGLYKSPDDLETQKQITLRTKDSDRDGLSDYDELNIWRTSPYLDDSDSDGFDDKKEIETGNNPNCPKGNDCGQSSAGEAAKVQSSDSAGGVVLSPEELLNPSGAENQDSDYLDILKNLGADDIRSLLIQNGVPAEKIKDLTDEQLAALYKSSVEETEKQINEQSKQLEAGASGN